MSKHLTFLCMLLAIPFSADAAEQVDPMRPDDQSIVKSTNTGSGAKAATKSSPQISLWIQSIQIGEDERSANISGKLVKVGDKIRGAQVIAIEHNQVRLRRGGELIKLKFLPRKIKR
ncbi:MAG: hypothetical protein OQK78_00875 [Gammaproteobacteria bacterium]|nr:hypothetical protein [Gammaproteobacteria bacterium]